MAPIEGPSRGAIGNAGPGTIEPADLIGRTWVEGGPTVTQSALAQITQTTTCTASGGASCTSVDDHFFRETGAQSSGTLASLPPGGTLTLTSTVTIPAPLSCGSLSNGDLNVYYGASGGGFSGQKTIGTGWNGIDAIVGAFDANGDGVPDLLGRDASNGNMRLYTGTASGILTGGKVVGTGWGGLRNLTLLVAPWSGPFVIGTDKDQLGKAFSVGTGGALTLVSTAGSGLGMLRLWW